MIDKNDWRLLNDVNHLRGAYINPTDGEEICQNAKHLNHCVFCYDTVYNDRHQFWYVPESVSCCICESCFKDFNEMFKWKLLDGYDIEWTLKDTIDTYIQKIKLHDIKYSSMIPYSKISADIKDEFSRGNFFLKKTEYTDTSLFKKEFGYELPQDLQEYLNLYWHPGIFGWDKFYECIVLDAVLKYENESADDVFTGTHGLIYHAKKWRDLFGGNINEYLPIGILVSPESYVLYEIKTGRIFMEDADNEGKPEKEPFENSLKELIQHLQPVRPAYMDLKFTLEDVEHPMYKKGDFQYEAHVGKGMFYNVLADGRPYFQVEAYPKKLFETAEIYLHYLLIGTDCDMVYIFDLWDLKANILPKVIKVNGYFLSFYYNTDPQCAFPENIFITDSFGIIALDHHLAELWRNHDIADDGVSIHDIIDSNTMRVSCGMDPPDGDWVDKLIDVRTGEVVG